MIARRARLQNQKGQWLHSPLFVGLGDAFRCAFLTSDWMCISCHKVCNQTSPCPFYEFVCAVWGIFFVWTFFHMFHSWISSLLVFLFSLCLHHNLTGVFANYPSVCTHSHTFHTQTCFLCEFSCALQAHPLPHFCHKRCTFQLCGHFQCASSKYMLCGTFFHRCYSWTHFFGGILCSACWNKVDCWILFHNRHIDFGLSLLNVRNATQEFVNLQNSKYFRFLKDSKPSFHPNSICYFLLFWQFLGQCD